MCPTKTATKAHSVEEEKKNNWQKAKTISLVLQHRQSPASAEKEKKQQLVKGQLRQDFFFISSLIMFLLDSRTPMNLWRWQTIRAVWRV